MILGEEGSHSFVSHAHPIVSTSGDLNSETRRRRDLWSHEELSAHSFLSQRCFSHPKARSLGWSPAHGFPCLSSPPEKKKDRFLSLVKILGKCERLSWGNGWKLFDLTLVKECSRRLICLLNLAWDFPPSTRMNGTMFLLTSFSSYGWIRRFSLLKTHSSKFSHTVSFCGGVEKLWDWKLVL